MGEPRESKQVLLTNQRNWRSSHWRAIGIGISPIDEPKELKEILLTNQRNRSESYWRTKGLKKLLLTSQRNCNKSYWRTKGIGGAPIDEPKELERVLLTNQRNWENSYWRAKGIEASPIDEPKELKRFLLTSQRNWRSSYWRAKGIRPTGSTRVSFVFLVLACCGEGRSWFSSFHLRLEVVISTASIFGSEISRPVERSSDWFWNQPKGWRKFRLKKDPRILVDGPTPTWRDPKRCWAWGVAKRFRAWQPAWILYTQKGSILLGGQRPCQPYSGLAGGVRKSKTGRVSRRPMTRNLRGLAPSVIPHQSAGGWWSGFCKVPGCGQCPCLGYWGRQ